MTTSLRWTRWHGIAAAILLALSAFVHFSAVLETKQSIVIHSDAAKYVFYAYNIKHQHTFSRQQTFGPGHQDAQSVPDKLTLPGYPAFLSLFIDGVPDQALIRRVTLAQAALGVASTLLSFLIALRLVSLGWAFAAGMLVAIQPHLAIASTYLLTEPLFTFLTLAAVLGALAAIRSRMRLPWCAFAGLLLGLACMVRPQLQLVPVLVLVVALSLRRFRPYLPGIALSIICFVAVVGPWYLRNATVPRPEGDPSLLAASIYNGSFPNLMYQDDPRTLGYAYRFDPDAKYAMRDVPSALSSLRARFTEQPGRYLRWYLLGKPGFFLSWGMITGGNDLFVYEANQSSPFMRDPVFIALKNASFAAHWPLMLLAIAAMLVALWRPRILTTDPSQIACIRVLAALFLYLIVLHCIGAPYPRYNIPFRPLAFILAMVALRAAAAAILRSRQQPGAIAPP